jgi:protein SCO1/2
MSKRMSEAKPQRDVKSGLILFVLFVLPLTVYFLFKNFSHPVFQSFPYAYSLSESGDTIFQTLPEFTFSDAEGKPFTRDDMLGRVWVLSFFSEKDLMLSRVLNGNLRRVYDNIDEADFVNILSVHISDSVPLSAAYIDSMNVLPGKWQFVNASREAVFRIGKEAFHMEEFEHKSPADPPFTVKMIALIDKQGRVRKYVYGTDLVGIRQINEDIRALWLLEYKGK